MQEIDFKTADFDDIGKFAMNLLGVDRSHHLNDYDARIAYFTTSTQVLLGRKAAESGAKLATEIDNARSAVGRGLDKLERAIAQASEASDRTATRTVTQSQRIVWATWGLVVVTFLLAVATVMLVVYTRQLTFTAPTVGSSPIQTGGAP